MSLLTLDGKPLVLKDSSGGGGGAWLAFFFLSDATITSLEMYNTD